MFISTFNPNNPKVFNSIKTGIVQNNVNGFKDTRSIPPFGIDVLPSISLARHLFLLVKAESDFIVTSVETALGRWTLVVAVISADAYPFFGFVRSDLSP